MFRVHFAALALLAAPAAAAELEVSPNPVLEGEAVAVSVNGLKPGEAVTVHAQSAQKGSGGEARAFHARASFTADASGRIDLASAAPASGDYSGPDIRGLFWSQVLVSKQPERGERLKALGLSQTEGLSADQVRLSLEVDGKVADQETLTLLPASPTVRREAVRTANGLVGALYVEVGAKKRPVVVILSGSEGGLDYADWLGPKLASRGYAAFGLGYFAPGVRPVDGLPTALNMIPVERLEAVRAWLQTRPEADVERFGVVGASKGGEFALVLASVYPWIDAAVAFTPSNLVTQGFLYGSGEEGMQSSWSRAGKPLAFLPQTGLRAEVAKVRIPGSKVRMGDVRKINEAKASPALIEAAAIKVENSHAALLMLGGADDVTGVSGLSVDRLRERLQRKGFKGRYEAVSYPNAGHQIVDTGWRPTTTHNDGPFVEGGTAEGDAHAQADGWARMLAFLKRELKPR